MILVSLKCLGQTTELKNPFAKIKGNTFVILQDTTQFKSDLINVLFSDTLELTKPVFDKIEIRKQVSFGEENEEYYFVLVYDLAKKIKVAKWLDKIGDNLFLSNQVDNDNYFHLYYIICKGPDDCFPEVGVIDSHKYWSCGRELMCKKDSKCRKSIVSP